MTTSRPTWPGVAHGTGWPGHIIFDLDGTLVDSAAGVLEALRRAFDSKGLIPAIEIGPSIVGPPLRTILQAAADTKDEAVLSDLESAFRRHYDSESFVHATPYPGVTEALHRLRSGGITLHVATNKRTLPTLRILAMLRWQGLFDSINCVDSIKTIRPGKAATVAGLIRRGVLNPPETLLVGDALDDAEAAMAVGIQFLAVTWGYGSNELIGRWPQLPRVASPADI